MNPPTDTPAPQYVKCECEHCESPIEFDASDFADGETRRVECPFCQQETAVQVPRLAHEPPVVFSERTRSMEPIWFGGQVSLLEIQLCSGASSEIVAVKLFNSAGLQELASSKAIVAEHFSGTSSGLVPWGSLSWVLVASAAIGAVEAVMTNKAAKEGMAIWQRVLALEKQVRNQGVFFPVGMVDEIAVPAPGLWNVPPQACYPCGFSHNGDEFVTVKDSEGKVHSIRWSAVACYAYHPNGLPIG